MKSPTCQQVEFIPLWEKYLDAAHASGQQADGCAVLISCNFSALSDPPSTCRLSLVWSVMAAPRITTAKACRKSASRRLVPLMRNFFIAVADGHCQPLGIGDFEFQCLSEPILI